MDARTTFDIDSVGRSRPQRWFFGTFNVEMGFQTAHRHEDTSSLAQGLGSGLKMQAARLRRLSRSELTDREDRAQPPHRIGGS